MKIRSGSVSEWMERRLSHSISVEKAVTLVGSILEICLMGEDFQVWTLGAIR